MRVDCLILGGRSLKALQTVVQLLSPKVLRFGLAVVTKRGTMQASRLFLRLFQNALLTRQVVNIAGLIKCTGTHTCMYHIVGPKQGPRLLVSKLRP